MKATRWEFANRALLFGLIFAVVFSLSSIDSQNSAAALSNWISLLLRVDAALVARFIFGVAALMLAVAALIRTWASSYLHADVVYAADVKTDSLIADGPYRRVRNPLYFGNVLMAVGIGAMMSRAGLVFEIAAIVLFCYRLIFREEAELLGSQGNRYETYRRAVPRLWPSLRPRIPSAGRQPKWAEGFKAEAWYWGFPIAVLGFALTLNVKLFLALLGVSLVLLWVSSAVLQKR
jgi:protein-S-isoprenylcysteine O-methyltransferase Ste14